MPYPQRRTCEESPIIFDDHNTKTYLGDRKIGKLMKRIHVAVMLHYFFFRESTGGSERQLASIIPFLQKRNIDISIISRHRTGIVAPDFEESHGVKIYRGPNLVNNQISSAYYFFFTLTKLRQIQPNIIQAQGLFSPTLTALTYKHFFQDIPVVLRVLRGGVLGDIIRLKAKPFGRRRLRDIAENTNGFLSISDEITKELLAENIPQHKIWEVPNGVDIERFKPVSSDEKQALRQRLNVSGDPVVVFVGRLAPEKRAGNLIASWSVVHDQHPNAQLLIVGQGADREKLEASAGDGIRFVGAVENVEEWLQVADIFVLPSIAEGLSNALLEAMASGLPIVVTAVGDAPQLIKPDKNGWCIPPDDIDALTTSFLEAFGNRDMLKVMGANNRQRIVDDYQLDVTARKWRELYDSVF